jgi:hypothetical protein
MVIQLEICAKTFLMGEKYDPWSICWQLRFLALRHEVFDRMMSKVNNFLPKSNLQLNGRIVQSNRYKNHYMNLNCIRENFFSHETIELEFWPEKSEFLLILTVKSHKKQHTVFIVAGKSANIHEKINN